MKVRPIRRDDVSRISELSRELARHVSDPDPGCGTSELLEFGFGDDRWFDAIVVDSGSEILGFALFCRLFEAHTRSRKLWLSDLVVAKSHRQTGVGKLLVGALRDEASRMGCKGIVLDLWTKNSVAREFYTAVGGRRESDIETWLIPAANP